MRSLWFFSSLALVAIASPGAVGVAGAATSGSDSVPAVFSLEEYRTTAGAIAIGNLEDQIERTERHLAESPATIERLIALADLLGTRGQFLGRLADYERAASLAEELVRVYPRDPRTYLARAVARGRFHCFDDALADLDRAESLGAPLERVRGQRAGVLQALGRFDESLDLRQEAIRIKGDITSLGGLASLHGDRGDFAIADQLFTDAQTLGRDTSPFPLAWLYFTQGTMWMRAGDLERARVLLSAACARLPEFTRAAGHLAEVEAALGDRSGAIARLRPLAAAGDDPDYTAQLARILHESGEHRESRVLRDRAAAAYESLLATRPEAFADHAAEFWLEPPAADAERALHWARRNLELRSTPRSYQLVLEAEMAAGKTGDACATARQAVAAAPRDPVIGELARRALAACNEGLSATKYP